MPRTPCLYAKIRRLLSESNWLTSLLFDISQCRAYWLQTSEIAQGDWGCSRHADRLLHFMDLLQTSLLRCSLDQSLFVPNFFCLFSLSRRVHFTLTLSEERRRETSPSALVTSTSRQLADFGTRAFNIGNQGELLRPLRGVRGPGKRLKMMNNRKTIFFALSEFISPDRFSKHPKWPFLDEKDSFWAFHEWTWIENNGLSPKNELPQNHHGRPSRATMAQLSFIYIDFGYI